MLKSGLTYQQKNTVDETETADKVSSGSLPVYATPKMIAFIEDTATQAVQPELESGQTTVGIKVNIDHLNPTPVGETVTCTVELTKIDGSQLYFDVIVEDETDTIGRGEHIRYIVNKEEFMERV